MNTKSSYIDKLYANKTKEVTSLKTEDIEGARPRARIRERNMDYGNRNKSPEFMNNAMLIQQQGNYNNTRNPDNYNDANMIRYRQNLNNQHMNNDSVANRIASHNEQYRDSLEQLQNSYNVDAKTISSRRTETTYSQNGSKPGTPMDGPEDMLVKKDYANFYGIDDDSTKNFVYKNIDSNLIRSAPLKKDMNAIMQSKMNNADRNIFVQEKAAMDPSFNNNAQNFYAGETTQPKDQFINNYYKFFRGSTPTGNKRVDSLTDPTNIRKSYDMVNKKKDMYTWNCISNKPTYLYSIDAGRLKNTQEPQHFQKYANNKSFKNAQANFYAVEDQGKINFAKRQKPANNFDELVTTSHAYGSLKPLNF